MKKLFPMVLVAISFLAITSITSLAQGTEPYPTKPPGITSEAMPQILIADTEPYPTKPPGVTTEALPQILMADTEPYPTKPPGITTEASTAV